MKNLKEYQWNYVAAVLFALTAVIFILQNNSAWIAFFPLSIVFFALGDNKRPRK